MTLSKPSQPDLSTQFTRIFDPFGVQKTEFKQHWGNLFDPFGLMQKQFNAEFSKLLDPFGIHQSYFDIQQAWSRNPQKLATWLMRLNTDAWAVQFQSWERCCGIDVDDTIPAVIYDERFNDPIWTENPYLDTIKEYYLLYTRWLEDAIYDTEDVSDISRQKAGFWARQGLNAMAPTNFFWTNPRAVQKFVETGGQSLSKGLKNFMQDMESKNIRMVEPDAFEVGKDLANTEGSVVYRNELFELIQYQATTEKVHAIPLLFIPPWINKFYILDLGKKKSMVRYLVDKGYTVFLISWKNPTKEMRHLSMDDYMLKGVLEAITVSRQISHAPHVHSIGYCIGGTILTAMMAWLNNDAQAEMTCPVGSWSLFTTMVDFEHAGELDIFIDENIIEHIEKIMAKQGFLDGKEMAGTFRMLRSNSLIWHYFVHNYLYGEELPKFDVLYWNMDSTRMPEAMHSFYLREFYLHNKFAQPKGLTLGGRALNIRDIKQPLYAVGTEQDHIAPWKETFKINQLVAGESRYVLATSGHILGIITPPVDPPKRRYWVGNGQTETDPNLWREGIEKIAGSWWDDWDTWLTQHCGEYIDAPKAVGTKEYPALAAAPGTYVMES